MSSVEDESIHLWDFNSCNGNFSNYTALQPTDIIPDRCCRGVAFSPNSRFLYAGGSNRLYQFDLCRSDVNSSIHILTADDEDEITYARIATSPSGKLYVSQFFYGDTLSSIHQPNLQAGSADFRRLDLAISQYSVFNATLPHMPHYRIPTYTLDCHMVTDTDNYKGQEEYFKLFPNPASDVASIDQVGNIYTTQDLKIEIWDAQGKLVYEDQWYSVQEKTIDTSQLLAGGYYVTIVADQSITIKKLVVQKQ